MQSLDKIFSKQINLCLLKCASLAKSLLAIVKDLKRDVAFLFSSVNQYFFFNSLPYALRRRNSNAGIVEWILGKVTGYVNSEGISRDAKTDSR